jgi:hypothetical protein
MNFKNFIKTFSTSNFLLVKNFFMPKLLHYFGILLFIISYVMNLASGILLGPFRIVASIVSTIYVFLTETSEGVSLFVALYRLAIYAITTFSDSYYKAGQIYSQQIYDLAQESLIYVGLDDVSLLEQGVSSGLRNMSLTTNLWYSIHFFLVSWVLVLIISSIVSIFVVVLLVTFAITKVIVIALVSLIVRIATRIVRFGFIKLTILTSGLLCSMLFSFYFAFYMMVTLVSHKCCYDNLMDSPIHKLINEFAFDNKICTYTVLGSIKYYIYLNRIYAAIYLIAFLFHFYRGLKHISRKGHLPSLGSFLLFHIFEVFPSQEQILMFCTIKIFGIYLSNNQFQVLRANLVKTYKTNKKHADLYGLMSDLPKTLPAKRAHVYEADCRKVVRNTVIRKLKEIGADQTDYGTKRHNGTSAYMHHGDMRYDAKVGFPQGKVVTMFDVSLHLDDESYADILKQNQYTIEYVPTPINTHTTKAIMKDQNTIIYDQQVPDGDLHNGELFRLLRCTSNDLLSTYFGQLCISQQAINIGDHHILRTVAATMHAPSGFFKNSDVTPAEGMLLMGPTKTLFVTKTTHHLMKTKHAEFLSRHSNYDRASTTSNALCKIEFGFDIVEFSNNAECCELIKQTGKPIKFDLRKRMTRCIEIIPVVEQPVKTETKMEEPPVHKTMVSSERPISLVTNQNMNAKPVKRDQAGLVYGSEPVKSPCGPAKAFFCRYLNKPCPTDMKTVNQIPEFAFEFISYIKEQFGTITFDETLKKPKHNEVTSETKHHSDKATKDMSTCEVFVKRETYAGKANHLRMISNQSKDLVAKLTPFTAALHKHFSKNCDWYMPGKKSLKPKMYLNTNGGDYSQYESSQSLPFRLPELFCYMLFAAHSDEYLYLIEQELNTTFKFDVKNFEDYKIHMKDPKFKIYVNALCKRLSGSAFTTVGNTLVAAFLQYLFYRTQMNLSINESYSNIRACYGDDSLVKDGDIVKMQKFFKGLGFILTVEASKGPGLRSLVGKVLHDNGRFTLDAERVINKFMVAHGKYDYTTNILNKWAGNFNPSSKTQINNVFSLIGKWAHGALGNKLEICEYKFAVTDHGLNDTFEKAFRGQHKETMIRVQAILEIYARLVGNSNNFKINQKIINETIAKIAEQLEGFISKFLPLKKKGTVVTGNEIIAEGTKFEIDSKNIKNYAYFTRTYSYKVNEFLKLKNITNIRIKGCKIDNYLQNIQKLVKACSLTEHVIGDLESEPRQSQNFTQKPSKQKTPKNEQTSTKTKQQNPKTRKTKYVKKQKQQTTKKPTTTR